MINRTECRLNPPNNIREICECRWDVTCGGTKAHGRDVAWWARTLGGECLEVWTGDERA